MDKVKIGIIGCGGIANGKHMPSYKTLSKEADMVAFCDLEKERAAKANVEYGDGKGKVFSDYNELLSCADIDAVCVCTPNISHCEITVAALKAGKHVICEKPMAITFKEAQQMISAATKYKRLLTIGYQNRYRNDTLYLKKECESGALGEIYFAKARAIRRRAVPTWGVFLDETKQGGGSLIDIGTHSLDLTLFMMDNYKPAYAVGTTYHKLNKDTNTGNAWGDWETSKFKVEDSAFGFIVMENGATIIIETSWALNTLEVGEAITSLCGTKGGADIPSPDKLRLNGIKHGRQIVETPDFTSGGVDFFDGVSLKPQELEAKTFLNAIKGNGNLYVLPNQAAVVTQILEGIYKSAKANEPYYFNE